ncbi:MAG: nucleotide pyrophosphohydrolase [Promethearchaeota archaeon]
MPENTNHEENKKEKDNNNEGFSDENTNILKLRQEMEDFLNERGWKSYHKPKELAIALSIEAAELLELFLFKDPTNEQSPNESPEKPNGITISPELKKRIEEEAADIFAYLISLINAIDSDLTRIYLDKMKKNREKYPVSEFHDGYYRKK